MREKDRIEGFDIAKTVAIILLFFVHSNLNQTQPFVTQRIQYFFLGIFFYASGYFAVSSLKSKGRMRFLGGRALKLYIPYIAFTIFYLAIGYPRYTNNFFSFATGLNLYAPLGIESYNLWFVPALLLCLLLSALCFDNPLALVFAVLGMFVFQGLANLALWRVPIFMVVYLFGYLHKRWESGNYSIFAILAVVLFFVPFYLSSPSGSNQQAMISETFYTLASVVPFMVLMARSKIRIPFVRRISESTLYIYLAEPIVTSLLAVIFFGTQWGESIGSPMMFPFILVRIVSTFALGTAMSMILHKLRRQLLLRKHPA